MNDLLSPTIPAEGWYRLTADVTNPYPDGRKKEKASAKVWPKGTVVYVKHSPVGMRNEVQFNDKSYVFVGSYSREKDYDKVYCQGNGILENLEVAELTVGRFIKKAWSDPEQLLAALVDKGLVTLPLLQNIDKELESLPEDEFDAFNRRHTTFYAA